METNSVKFFKQQEAAHIEHPPIVAAYQVKTPQNVGSLMRLCDNIGSGELWLIDDANPKRELSIKKTAGMSYKNVNIIYLSADEFLEKLPSNYTLTAIETAQEATNIYQTKLDSRIAYLLGSETKGIPEKLLNKCKQAVYIPMPGKCKSLNISHALAVALFEWQRQHFY